MHVRLNEKEEREKCGCVMNDRRRGEGAWGWHDRYLVSNDGLGAQLLLTGITQGGSDCVSVFEYVTKTVIKRTVYITNTSTNTKNKFFNILRHTVALYYITGQRTRKGEGGNTER